MVLNHETAAKRHLYLQATPFGVYCIDFELRKSMGHRVDFWVSTRRPLKVGPYRLTVQTDPPVERTNNRHKKWNTRIPDDWRRTPVLKFYSDGEPMGEYPIRRRLTSIGSHALNNIALKTRSVSEFHAVFIWNNDELWVVDLFSTSGTRLFGAEIDASDFKENAELGLGRIEISYAWVEDWKPVVAEYRSLWLPAKSPAVVGESPPLVGDATQSELETEQESQNAAVDEIEPQPDASNDEIERLEQRTASLRNEISQLTDERGMMADQIAEDRRIMDASRMAIELLKTEQTSLADNLVKLTGERESLADQINEDRRRLDESRMATERQKAEATSLAIDVAESAGESRFTGGSNHGKPRPAGRTKQSC